MKTFICSDLHLGHNKDFLYGPRGFDSPEEHTEEVIKRWNEVVGEHDEVYFLGDIALSIEVEEAIKLINRLNGTIYWVFGNHDTSNRIHQIEMNCPHVITLGYAHMMKYKKYHFYLSHYPTLCDNYDDGENLKAKVINICGHSHTKDPFYDWEYGTIFHAELDTNDCYPWLLDDIIEKLKIKTNKILNDFEEEVKTCKKSCPHPDCPKCGTTHSIRDCIYKGEKNESFN